LIAQKLDGFGQFAEVVDYVIRFGTAIVVVALIGFEKDRFHTKSMRSEYIAVHIVADKKHLFTMAKEDRVFSRGHDRMLVRYRGWNIAMIVCYDIRFPVWCRNKDNEYDLLIAVANWPQVRVDAWNQLLKARAIENEAYVCGVNCKGTDNYNFLYTGDSAAIDFKGKAINICQEDSDIIYAVLDHEKLDAFRTKFPAWKDADPFTLTDI
jgi:predicted amidohydrolase